MAQVAVQGVPREITDLAPTMTLDEAKTILKGNCKGSLVKTKNGQRMKYKDITTEVARHIAMGKNEFRGAYNNNLRTRLAAWVFATMHTA